MLSWMIPSTRQWQTLSAVILLAICAISGKKRQLFEQADKRSRAISRDSCLNFTIFTISRNKLMKPQIAENTNKAYLVTPSMKSALAESNCVAHHYAGVLMGKKSYRQFRQVIIDFYSGRTLSADEQAIVDAIPAEDLEKIMWVHRHLDELTAKLIYLAVSIGTRVASFYECDSDDVRDQAKEFLLWGIYGYTKTSVKLSTYARHVIRRECVRYVFQKHIGLGGSSSDLTEMKQSYFEAYEQLIRDGVRPSYHVIRSYLKLNDRDANKLMGAMAGVSSMYVQPSEEAKSLFMGLSRQDQRNEAGEACDYIYNNLLDASEQQVFDLLRQGKTQVEVAESLGRNVSEIRNIFNRIKRKAREHHEQEQAA